MFPPLHFNPEPSPLIGRSQTMFPMPHIKAVHVLELVLSVAGTRSPSVGGTVVCSKEDQLGFEVCFCAYWVEERLVVRMVYLQSTGLCHEAFVCQ